MKTLKENLTFLMTKRGLNPKSLSKAAGLNETYVRDILIEKMKMPGMDKLAKLCKALEVMPHELMPELRDLYPTDALEILAKVSAKQEQQREIKKEISKL